MSLSPPPSRTPAGVLAPPYEPWPVFLPKFVGRWRQGQHVLCVGPAGSGKTVLARVLARVQPVTTKDGGPFTVVLGTKMRDPEVAAYMREGYTRIEDWPPPRRAMRPLDDGSIRLALWPKIRTRDDLRRHRPVFARCLDSVLSDGGWTVVADEGLWLSSRAGLDLGEHLSAIAYTGRSSGVTLMMIVQRPRGVPVNSWSNASHAFVFHSGVTDDQRELASLGTHAPKDVQLAIQRLRGHQFLYLPLRAGDEWAISQVAL